MFDRILESGELDNCRMGNPLKDGSLDLSMSYHLSEDFNIHICHNSPGRYDTTVYAVWQDLLQTIVRGRLVTAGTICVLIGYGLKKRSKYCVCGRTSPVTRAVGTIARGPGHQEWTGSNLHLLAGARPTTAHTQDLGQTGRGPGYKPHSSI